MKNLELNKKLGFKVLAVLTSTAMIMGGVTACGKTATESATVEEATVTQAETESDDAQMLSGVMQQIAEKTGSTDKEPKKDEVVYVMADAMGNTQKIIVSDCLKNTKGEEVIEDASNLTDIENVKGNETYTVDADGNMVWNADGNDIYYQGTTDKELPVDVAITYELDGEEITPEELVGKSGNVTIRFTYTNHEKTTVEVNGKEKEVYVPFAMVSGAVLPGEHFSNIEVTNGKVLSEGNTNVVVGMAFPGLKESINIDSLKEKAVDEEAKEKLDEVEIPESVEITAYATDFQMNQTMTMALSDVLSDMNLGDTFDIDLSKITDSMDELKDASNQLIDGTTELHDSTKALQEGAQTLADKSKDLDKGAGDLQQGAKELDSGAEALNNGALELKNGIDQANNGAQSLKDGTAALVSGASDLNDGAGQLKSGIEEAASGVDALKVGLERTDADNPGLMMGYQQIKAGVDELIASVGAATGNVTGQVTGAVTNLATYFGGQAAAASQAAGASSVDGTPALDAGVPSFGGLAPEAGEDSSYNADEVAAYIAAVNEYVASVESYSGAVSGYQSDVNNFVSNAQSYYENLGKAEAYGDALTRTQEMGSSLSGLGGGGNSESSQKIAALQQGMKDVEQGIANLDAGINLLQHGEDGQGGFVALKAGASKLAQGTDSAVNGARQLADGASQLKDGTSQLSSGAQTLKDGTQSLKDGTTTLLDGTATLKDGTGQFVTGTAELNDGAVKLMDGSQELMDGMLRFDEEGIRKLTDLFGDNVQDVLDELQAVCNAGKNYQIYSEASSDMDSSVKFIYKTDAVK